MKICLITIVWVSILLQNKTLANRCVEFYEKCCSDHMTKRKFLSEIEVARQEESLNDKESTSDGQSVSYGHGQSISKEEWINKKGSCDLLDCYYYQRHKEKEYMDDNQVAHYNDPVSYWFSSEPNGLNTYECMSPNHVKQKVKQDALGRFIEKMGIYFHKEKDIFRRTDRTRVNTSFFGLFNSSDLKDYHHEGVEVKAKNLFLFKSIKNNSSKPGVTITFHVPLKYFPNYEWALEFTEHRNSSPPWVDEDYDHTVWGRGSRFIFALSDVYFIINGTSYNVTENNLDQFDLVFVDASHYEITTFFKVEDKNFFVKLKLTKSEDLWKAESLTGSYKGEEKKISGDMYKSNNTFYSDNPIEIKFKDGEMITIKRFGVELSEDGVSYHFSGKYLTREDRTSTKQTTIYTESGDEDSDPCSCKSKFITCECKSHSPLKAQRAGPCKCVIEEKCETCKCNSSLLNSVGKALRVQPVPSHACQFKSSKWHKVASQSVCCLFAYVLMTMTN